MRKLIIVFVTISLTLFCGCAVRTQDVTSGRELGKEVLRCFDEEDSEGLKALFCAEIQNTHNLDKEIAEAMNLYEGTMISCGKALVSGGEAVDNGKLTDKHIGSSVDEIKTNQGKEYEIVTHSYLIYDKNPRCIGITYLKLFDESTGEMVQIGEYVY